MVDEDIPTILLSWSGESYAEESEEPSDFIYETSGDLFAVGGETDERELAGKFRLYYVDVDRAINDDVSVFDVLDSYSQTIGYYDLFDPNSPDLSDHVINLLENDVFGSNVLILDRLEILPKFRGKCAGLAVMSEMIRRFSAGAALVAIKPFPLQFEPAPASDDEKEWRTDLGLAKLPKAKGIATKKLFDYYSRLGFRRFGRTPFMVRGTGRPLPSFRELST